LLSFKSTNYQIDKLLNGQVITGTIADSDKPKIVTAVVPKTSKVKDFLTGIITENNNLWRLLSSGTKYIKC
jgi:hypothetical protein